MRSAIERKVVNVVPGVGGYCLADGEAWVGHPHSSPHSLVRVCDGELPRVLAGHPESNITWSERLLDSQYCSTRTDTAHFLCIDKPGGSLGY